MRTASSALCIELEIKQACTNLSCICLPQLSTNCSTRHQGIPEGVVSSYPSHNHKQYIYVLHMCSIYMLRCMTFAEKTSAPRLMVRSPSQEVIKARRRNCERYFYHMHAFPYECVPQKRSLRESLFSANSRVDEAMV